MFIKATGAYMGYGKSAVIKGVIFFALPLLWLCVFAQQKKQSIMQRGKKVYESNCMICHRTNGEGVAGLNPPLYRTAYVTGNKQRLIKIVLSGMNQTIEVHGKHYNTAMKAFDFLSDSQISDVLTYIRRSFGNKASAVSPALVKNVREKTL